MVKDCSFLDKTETQRRGKVALEIIEKYKYKKNNMSILTWDGVIRNAISGVKGQSFSGASDNPINTNASTQDQELFTDLNI